MTAVLINLLVVFSILLIIGTVLPYWNVPYWWVRCFDFPRLQFIFVTTACFLIITIFCSKNTLMYSLMGGLVFAIIIDLYRIMPYSPINNVESIGVKAKSDDVVIKLLSANIERTNRDYGQLLDLVSSLDLNLLILIETDQKWSDYVTPELKKSFPYIVDQSQDNTYGMMVFSKFPLKETKVKFLVEDDVPSIFTNIDLGQGKVVELISLHPRPPRPSDGPSIERDAELMIAAEYIKKSDLKGPILVSGDLNDVAWSHTTRLFKRVSRLLDPRVGRGVFPTFPVYLKLFRFPLDHIFHSHDIGLVDFRVEKDIGSDHFPVYSSWVYNKSNPNDKPDKPDQDDKSEAQDLIDRAKE